MARGCGDFNKSAMGTQFFSYDVYSLGIFADFGERAPANIQERYTDQGINKPVISIPAEGKYAI